MSVSKKKEIVIAHADDWVGIYVNGILVAEGHCFNEEELLNHVGVKSESKWVDDAWITETERGRLPKHLDDVRWEKTRV